MRTVDDIIEAAGGLDAVASRMPNRDPGSDPKWAIFKWRKKGIPVRHWTLLIEMSDATAEELLQINMALTAESEAA